MSVHITFGAKAPSMHDVVRRALLAALEPELARRSVLPWCDGAGAEARRAEDDALAIEALRRATANVTVGSLHEAAQAVWSPQARSWGGAFVRSWAAHTITETSWLRRVPGTEVSIVVAGEHVDLLLRRRRVRLPGWLSDAVGRLVDSPVAVQLGSIGLAASDALVLGRRLVVEGLLEEVDAGLTGANGELVAADVGG